MVKKIIIVSIIMTAILLPNFSFGQSNQLEEREELLEIIKKNWREEILPIWQKMWNWFKENIWARIINWIRPEVEKRKGYLKESFGEEKEEIKEEIPKVSESLWQRFRKLIE